MALTVRHAAGSLLVVGLSGAELTALERAWLKLVRPAGVILFRRNIVDAEQTRALLDEATGLGGRHAVRCVDVEGGTVNRLRDALSPIASAQAVAAAARKDGAAVTLARKHGELIARATKAFGFNTTLAPVVDLTLPEATEVLGSRTTGATATDVMDYAREFLMEIAAQGVVGCGKHFPGLGGATGDTHFVTPAIERTLEQLWNEDVVPYRELHKQMPMIMTNHAAYPQTPGKNEPASASRFWITETLRKKIGYKGIILSDDLEMGGILKFLPVEQAAIAAVRAGTDLLEICHSPELILRTYEALVSEGERSAAFRTVLLAQAQESLRKRARLYAHSEARALNSKGLEKLRSDIAKFNERVAGILQAADNAAPRAASPAEAS
ncbi:MAG TPA: beta-N-acetylhexosaminidase [Terracidiphilus sp.]|nr:beta-N-acetylhexosaminidase [Terracidiphilus sp.]